GLDVRALQGLLARPRAEVRELVSFGDDVPLPDAGPRQDPFVGSLDDLLEVRVGQDFPRHGGARAGDARPNHSLRDRIILYALTSLASRACSSAICAWIFSARCCLENSAAKRIAFLIALAEERPWQMMTHPFTPRSGAPPYSE